MKDLKGLAPNTKQVLESLSDIEKLKEYTFVGGSALSVHLKHRLSEDLDFFSKGKELDIEYLLYQIKEVLKIIKSIISLKVKSMAPILIMINL